MESKLISNYSIKPLIGIGVFKPGHHISDFKNELSSIFFDETVFIKKGKHLNTAYIDIAKRGIKIEFNIYSGIIQKIIADARCELIVAMPNGNIGIGSNVKELLNFFPDSWDTDDFYLWNINFPGLYFGFLETEQEFLFSDLPKYYDHKIKIIGMVAPNEKGDYDRYGMDWYKNKKRLLQTWVNPVI